jgi:integrase
LDDPRDPTYVPSLEEFFEDVERNIANKRARPKRTPHSLLKTATIAAIRKLASTGVRPIVVPQFVGHANVGGGRKYRVGQPGASDLLAIWHRQRDSQAHWQALFERAGGTYLIVRKPHEAVDCMLQWASQKGLVF